jgi:hypothetical protein
LDYTFYPFDGAEKRSRAVPKHAKRAIAVVAQKTTDAAGRVTVINAKSAVAFRVDTALTNAAFACLLAIELPIVSLGDPKYTFALLDDPAGFTLGIETPGRSVLLIELGRRLGRMANRTFEGSPVSSLCTFARVARTSLRIAFKRFP